MTDTLSQLSAVQHRADLLQAVQEVLADSTKILSNDIVSDLVKCTEPWTNVREQTIVSGYAQHHYQLQKLKDHAQKHASQLDVLQKELSDLRKYLGFATAEVLKEAVEAGITKPLPAPAKPAVHITVSDRDKILEQAKQRAAEAKARAERNRKELGV
jgi:hypothetical protein